MVVEVKTEGCRFGIGRRAWQPGDQFGRCFGIAIPAKQVSQWQGLAHFLEFCELIGSSIVDETVCDPRSPNDRLCWV